MYSNEGALNVKNRIEQDQMSGDKEHFENVTDDKLTGFMAESSLEMDKGSVSNKVITRTTSTTTLICLQL